MIRAGQRNCLVEFQTRTTASDELGGGPEGWVAKPRKAWVQIRPLEGAEHIAAMQAQAKTTHRVAMLYREDVTAAMRMVYGGRVFEIRSPPADPDGRRREMVFTAEEVPGGA